MRLISSTGLTTTMLVFGLLGGIRASETKRILTILLLTTAEYQAASRSVVLTSVSYLRTTSTRKANGQDDTDILVPICEWRKET